MRTSVRTLDTGWRWRQATETENISGLSSSEHSDEEQWCPAKQFPSEVHVELKDAGLIPDPYLESNEHKVQCKHR